MRKGRTGEPGSAAEIFGYGRWIQSAEAAPPSLCGIHEQVFKHVVAIVVITISLFLALYAEGSPGYRREALRTDFLLTMKASAERTVCEPAKRRADVPQQVRFAI